MLNKGVIGRFYGTVNAGKESKVYWATTPKSEDLAVKIYLTISAEFKKGMLSYVASDIRFSHVKRNTYSLVYAWALKEFKNLNSAYKAGVNVPKPLLVKKNVLIMKFIGKDGVSAPLLKDAELRKPHKIYKDLMENIKTLYKEGGLVHGDLSEYNVMLNDGRLVIFDMSQSTLKNHPLAEQFLRRDITNINRFFNKKGVKIKPENDIYEWIIKK